MPAGNNIGSVSIKVTPDTTGFREKVLAALQGVDDDIRVKVKLVLDENGIRQKIDAATAGLDSKATVKLDVDRSIFDKLPKTLPGGGGGCGGPLALFGGAASNIALIASVAAIAAPAIALITGALATLPAVAAAVAAPIGVIALGLDGIKKAAAGLSQPLADLKTSISGVFETRLTPVFAQLAGAMPKLEGPLKAVANGISDVAKSFVDTISTGPGLANLQGTIRNIANLISTMAPGVSSLTTGLLGLANNVSAKFPAVGKWFNDAADGFANWVNKAASDGSLNTAMDNLGTTLKGILDIGGDILKQGFDWLKDPNFGKTMTDFVNNMKTLVGDILPGLGDFFTQITSALNAIVPVLDKADTFFKNQNKDLTPPDQIQPGGFGKGIKKGSILDSILPDKFNLGDLFQGELRIAGMPLTDIAAKIKAAFDPANLFGGLDFAPLMEKIRVAFDPTPIVARLKAAFDPANLFGAGFDFSTTAFSGLVERAQAVVGEVKNVFSQIPGAVSGALANIGGVVAGAFGAAVAAVASAGAQMLAAVASAGAQIVGEVGSWAGRVAGAAASLAGSLAGVGGQMIAGFLGGFRSAAAAAVAEVAGWAAKIAGAARAALGIHSPSKVFTDIGAQTAQGLQDGLEGGFAGVIERAKTLAQQLTDAVNGGLAGVDQGVLSDGIKKQLAELELERKQLTVQKDALPKDDKEGRKGIQGQLDQVKAIKDQLALQNEQLGFSQKYGDTLDDTNKSQEMLGQSLTKMVDIGKGFAMANVQQFESDLGISGQGAIPQLAEQGLGWLTSTLGNLITGGMGGGTQIHVNSVDEALAAKQNIDNKKALQFSGR